MTDKPTVTAEANENRRPDESQSRVKWTREWSSLIISIFALTISATSAYFTVFQKSQILDGFSLIPPEMQQIGEMLIPKGPVKFIFVNKGKLPIAITGATVEFSECPEQKDKRCWNEHSGASRDTELEPFVIGAGEIVIKNISFDESPFSLKKIKRSSGEYPTVYAELNVEVISFRGIDGGSVPFGQWSFATSEMSDAEKKEILDREDDFPANISHGPSNILDNRWSIFGEY